MLTLARKVDDLYCSVGENTCLYFAEWKTGSAKCNKHIIRGIKFIYLEKSYPHNMFYLLLTKAFLSKSYSLIVC